jgi:hypothetical protein
MVKMLRRNGRTLLDERSLPINFQDIRHAPENELGVVVLFSVRSPGDFGFIEINLIQPHFPIAGRVSVQILTLKEPGLNSNFAPILLTWRNYVE